MTLNCPLQHLSASSYVLKDQTLPAWLCPLAVWMGRLGMPFVPSQLGNDVLPTPLKDIIAHAAAAAAVIIPWYTYHIAGAHTHREREKRGVM